MCACLALAGCSGPSRARTLHPPEVVVAPYAAADGGVLWAVAPLRNESGTSLIPTDRATDAVIAAAAEVRGVRVLPQTRTRQAMRALELHSVDTPEQARLLARTLGVDAIIVGTVTAWDPYNPPILGLNLALLGVTVPGDDRFDPRMLVGSPTDHGLPGGGLARERPLAIVSEHLDARNHQVLADLRNFATGRHDPRDALGWEIHLASMDLFTRFAAHYCVERLVQQEWVRVARETTRE